MRRKGIAFIGTAGLPNRYGGFESFLEACGPEFAEYDDVIVTCDAAKYPDRAPVWQGVRRMFLGVPANGAASVLHDVLAFARVLPQAHTIIILGVSGGIAFPLLRLACMLTGRRLIVNVDGVEWRRAKFSRVKRAYLRLSDTLAQWFAQDVVVDNEALRPFLTAIGRRKATCIPYSGDQVVRRSDVDPATRSGMLTICRIEPENNCHLLLEAATAAIAADPDLTYDFIGNWDASDYGRRLRTQFGAVAGITLHDPVYDPEVIAGYRERCTTYLHGHSVGGTNPSLVEMLFYDCRIVVFDCSFNRETAAATVEYFSDINTLCFLLHGVADSNLTERAAIRKRYTRKAITLQYRNLIYRLA